MEEKNEMTKMTKGEKFKEFMKGVFRWNTIRKRWCGNVSFQSYKNNQRTDG